jgi:hypothetical protein
MGPRRAVCSVGESRLGAAERVDQLEALQPVAGLGHLVYHIQDRVAQFLAFNIVILLSGCFSCPMSEQEINRAEQLPGPARADAVHCARLEVHQSQARCICPCRFVVLDVDPLKLQI